ncbi:DUF5677 domain-containing protein [Xanthobacter versatilis]|uniref:DUF5677 domain-containing protein n=1 Tax=Xanthobacter autotrophicus (strain ATCC BAA-1158 / Py2) TaxID=78245 RepID=UPI00372BB614
MPIAEQGFLSPDIAHFIGKHRQDNRAAFDLADALNRTAQRLMLSSEVRMEGDVLSEKNLAQLFFVRAVSNFQGAILMAERGAIVEARTLARTCLETVFALVAAVKMDACFIDRMVAKEMGSKSKYANWLLGRADRTAFLHPEAEAGLQAFINRLKADNELTKPFGADDMAQRAGIDGLYIFFRQFSSDAAHPTLEALNRYVDNGQGDVGIEIIWGPKCGAGEIADTVVMVCCFLMTGAVALNEITSVEGMGEALGGHYETYKALIAAMTPAEPA